MAQKIGAALIAHADTIWKTADTLRGAGIKEGDFPSYMMPFFALMLLESRLRRFKAEKVAEFEAATGATFDSSNQEHQEWLEAAAKAANKGYHPELLLLDKGLKETCAVPGGNFRNRLMSHLNQYDPETKKLLGLGYAEGTPKYLDIQGKASDLFSRPNSPLYAFASKWAAIDLTGFTNSEVTTMEEHIKRKWGDISAETAGEQYTPSDVIELSNHLVVEMWKRDGHAVDGIAKAYDMTCGGGNFLFASEDALRDAFPKLSVRTYGQELNDALYALAAIEARFRQDARIEHENTLTNDLFLSEKFDVIVANPPYGGDWKDYRAAIEADASGRFDKSRMPPVSDGQLLFLQHAAFHLAEKGIATIVHNGSTLFSGDAGGGESETRRWLLQELDLVEAIIQLPRGEFFNTDISTYMWVLNKAKPAERKSKVLLINAETCFTKLKRNLNKKNCEIDAESRRKVIESFLGFKDSLISKVIDVEALLYNKVDVLLHRHDADGRAIQAVQTLDSSQLKILMDEKVFIVEDGTLAVAQADLVDPKKITAEFNESAKSASSISAIESSGIVWFFSHDDKAIQKTVGSKITSMGLGEIVAKAKVAKRKGVETIAVEVRIEPVMERDAEITSFANESKKNEELMDNHFERWVREPFVRRAVKLGCEINFNKTFPRSTKGRTANEVVQAIGDLDKEMRLIEREIAADIAKEASK
jgi:type I restriction enzyme M protein